ncbi:MAG TPA: acyl-ACP--UDP-N-acetylglucosamine O-acyltransferase [Vicinamibacteria bacterium]
MQAAIDFGRLARQIPGQYPLVLVDRVLRHEPGSGLVAAKNVTGNEDFFVGHFPAQPVLPGVLLMDSLAQAAGLFLLAQARDPTRLEIQVVGMDQAKFRRPAVPGDCLTLDVRLQRRRGPLARFKGEVRAGDQRVAEALLLLRVVELPAPEVDPTARIAPGAELAGGVRVGPYSVVGPQVRLGQGTVLDSHVVIDGDTSVGAGNRFYPFTSIGLAPQDLKYHGEPTRVEIGERNVFREFVTLHRGTEGGGGLTKVGSDNLFMNGVHVAHDCKVGSHIIFGNAATLAGHVDVHDWAIVNAYSGVHQFCRVGEHAFVGGYTVATKDTLPFSKVVGNRACIYGINGVGLKRRGFSSERVAAIRQAYRTLVQSRLNTSAAVAKLEAEGPHTDDVRGLVAFIKASRRGVILKRRHRRTESDDE